MGPSITPDPERSACTEKSRLLYKYDAVLAEYSRTVSFLYKRVGVLRKEAYREISDFTDDARLRCEEARIALEEHIREHGC
ncbi:MAG TPA: hypothetical protein VER03_15685 [Bryobacteraceae bacterium]|nr:hypothetical protein [Bryobacteraceae bacterium]